FKDHARNRRLLCNECERLILIDCNFYRKDIPHLTLRLGIKLFAESHDVDSSTSKRRTDGRRWVCLTCRNLQLNHLNYFLCHYLIPQIHVISPQEAKGTLILLKSSAKSIQFSA